MHLDLSSLSGALSGLEKAIRRSVIEPDDDMIRDSVIQRFEYSYELCWKMLKRQLEQDVAVPTSVDAMPFKELIREGADQLGMSRGEQVIREFQEIYGDGLELDS